MSTPQSTSLRVDLLTREYPPHVYGGAGVHVAELSAVLRRHVDVRVRCFDGPRGADAASTGVTGYGVPASRVSAPAAFREAYDAALRDSARLSPLISGQIAAHRGAFLCARGRRTEGLAALDDA